MGLESEISWLTSRLISEREPGMRSERLELGVIDRNPILLAFNIFNRTVPSRFAMSPARERIWDRYLGLGLRLGLGLKSLSVVLLVSYLKKRQYWH